MPSCLLAVCERKGPREAVVQLTGSVVRITVLGGLTIMEEHLAEDRKNHEMVRHQRAVAYEEMAQALERLIGSAIARNVTMTTVEIDVNKNMDRIEFSLQ